MNAGDVLTYGQRTLLGTLDGVPEAIWETLGACGAWSIKDIVAHLTSYELVLLDILIEASGDGSATTPHLDRFRTLGGTFNDAEVTARAAQPVDETRAELDHAHARVMALAAGLPPETWRRTGTVPWYGAEYALDDLIVYLSYGHKREHSAQIVAFADRQTG